MPATTAAIANLKGVVGNSTTAVVLADGLRERTSSMF